MEFLSLESAKLWSEIVGNSFTAGAVFFGSVVAAIRFLLLPLGNHWHIEAGQISRRHVDQGSAYTISLEIENRSLATQHIRGWWKRVLFPDEAGESYNPNEYLAIFTEEDAVAHYGEASEVDDYPLQAGESFGDIVLKTSDTGTRQELCYIEYTLMYRRWVRKYLILPFRDWEFMSQILIVPVLSEDLAS